MTPSAVIARLDRVQSSLRLLAVGSVLAWSVAAAAIALCAAAMLRALLHAPTLTTALMSAVAAATVVAFWRWRALQPHRVARVDAALWAESHADALRYALVTLAEAPAASDADQVQVRLARYSATIDWQRPTDAALRQRSRRIVSQLVGACALSAVALSLWPTVTARADSPPLSSPAMLAGAAAPGRIRAQVALSPPRYTGRSVRSLAFGETVAAIVGSVISVNGMGPTSAATLLVQESADSGATPPRVVRRSTSTDGWRGEVRIGAVPLALRLRDAVGERWLLVTPVADSAPVATLLLPAADTLILDTTAVLRVSGTIHDDIGLRDARLEYIISSGGGEQFTFRSGALAERRGSIGRDITIATTIDLGALGLKPGDLMHLRLAAHDGNTLGGPTLGTSETRTIRIPRPDERDSVAVDQLPPTPVDKSVLSQRQLLALTERLVAKIPRIDRATMLAESQRIGNDQARLRKQVSDIVFARLGDTPSGEHAHYAGDGHDHAAGDLAALTTPERVLQAADRATGGAGAMLDSHGDETPVVAVNRPLLEAYNAMWDATRALQGGVPRDALDPMRRALAAIQRARSAERIYLRGTPPTVVVDLVRVRLIGTDSARFEARRALAALPPSERLVAARTLRALEQLVANRASALDSLRLVRLDALSAAPMLTSALNDVIGAVETGRDASQAVLRLHRLALAPWNRGAGNPLWVGGAP